jgi:flavin-dependent dehydrogenase
VGFKAHFSGVEMKSGVCEIYAFRGGYAGLTFVENGEANLCFLAKASLLVGKNDADVVYDELKKQNARAGKTLAAAEKLHDWLAVSVPAFGVNSFPETDGLFAIGDSAAFVDPFTGSGMLLAMESSYVLANCIAECGLNATAIRSQYLNVFHTRFSSRLKVSGLIRHVAYRPLLSRAVVIALSASGRLRKSLARRTRAAHPSEGL